MPPGLTAPQWHRLWHETLTRERRSRVRRAVWRGIALDDPDEAAVVVEYVRRHDGPWWTTLIQLIPPAGMLAFLVAIYEPGLSGNYWTWVGIQSVVLLVGPPIGVFRMRRTRRAGRLNQAVVDACGRPGERSSSEE